MQEHAKKEQPLSEEQLQVITGGCYLCAADLRRVTQYQEAAQTHLSQVEAARARNETRVARTHQGQATRNLRQAQQLVDSVAARGHKPPVPDLNLPAPRY